MQSNPEFMKRFFRSALLLLSVLSTAGCNRPSDKGAGISDLQTRYWNNESVRKGLYVKNVPATGVNAVSEAVICLAGREYHATGVNCYGLFSYCLKDGGIDLTRRLRFAGYTERTGRRRRPFQLRRLLHARNSPPIRITGTTTWLRFAKSPLMPSSAKSA